MITTVKGVVFKVLPQEKGVSKTTGKEWKKQTVVIEMEDNGKKSYLALTNFSAADSFGAIPVGSTVKMTCSVSSRQWQGNWYHDVIATNWTIEQYGAVDDLPEFAETPVTPTHSGLGMNPPVQQSVAPLTIQNEFNNDSLWYNPDDLPF